MEKIECEVVSASMVGTILEWYGVFLFSSGALYIGENFLPKSSPFALIAETLIIFAVGFLLRPIGAIVFGHYGDRIGRKNMLMITLVLSGFSTGLVGLLPTYQQIGVMAIVLLIILRLLLGFALGGEWGGAMLLTLENFKKRRGFWAAFVQSTVGIGLILGALAFYTLTSVLSAADMMSYGWRIPYIFSFVILIVGFYIRYKIPETPVFKAAKEENLIVKTPAAELFKKNWYYVLLGTLIAGSSGTFFYIGVALFPIVLELMKVITVHFAQVGIMLFAITEIISVFLGGHFSDKLGRRAMVISANIIFLIIVFPSFYFRSETLFLLFSILYGMSHGISYAPLGSMISEIFPTNVRYSGNSMAYQFGNAFVAGPASYASLALGGIAFFLYPLYAVLFSLIAIGSAIAFKETKDVTLEKAVQAPT